MLLYFVYFINPPGAGGQLQLPQLRQSETHEPEVRPTWPRGRVQGAGRRQSTLQRLQW